MIRKVVVSNFKRFEQQEFDIPDHLVIAGPNNSGKTSLLQAIAAWSEIAFQWLEKNPVLVRDKDGNYLSTNLNLLRFNSVPLADFDHLWKDKSVQEPASVRLHTDRWEIGFEILYRETELAAIRPAKDVSEDALGKYRAAPLIPVYIPPLSGLDVKEPRYDPVVIPARSAQAQAGSILRNMLLAVSQDAQKWQKLQNVIKSFFDYELSSPSGGAEIHARYRHSAHDIYYDLSSAASGFLQVLLVYVCLLHKNASVLLIDEPDAHLHILLQDKIYRALRDDAQQGGSQLIIATHSERLIEAADGENLRLLTSELRKVGDKRKLTDTLYLENKDIILAGSEPGILYVEGKTDIDILREWACILNHPLFPFLGKPFHRLTAEDKWEAVQHFSAMRLLVPDFRGVELCDGDKKKDGKTPSLPEGMNRLYWERYEIESYLLIRPKAVVRFVESVKGQEVADRIGTYMEQKLSDWQGLKPKVILSKIMQEAGLVVKETDYYQIAAQMTKEEIHPEVVEKLDAIANHFNIRTTQDELPE